MQLQSEYKKTCCIYCHKPTLRAKQENDWQAGEKEAKGYFPLSLNYWYCESCKRSSCSNKAVEIKNFVNIVTISQFFLWWFQYIDKR